jgi:hypothetical protein
MFGAATRSAAPVLSGPSFRRLRQPAKDRSRRTARVTGAHDCRDASAPEGARTHDAPAGAPPPDVPARVTNNIRAALG